MHFDIVALDADDTLWHNETLYAAAQDKLKELLSGYADGETVDDRLYQTEMSNLQYYGYGIKSFTLSMIETAVELTNGKIKGAEVRQIVGIAREMLTSEVRLLEHVEETVRELAKSYELMVIHRPDMVESDVRKQVEEVSATIDTSGNVTNTDFWGKRRFAYEIDHMNEGYYSVLDFEGETVLVDALDRALSLSDAVVRHKIVRRTDRES